MKRKKIILIAVMLMAALVYSVWPPKTAPAQVLQKDSGFSKAIKVDKKADANLDRLEKLKLELPPEKPETVFRRVATIIHRTKIKKVPVVVRDTVYKDTTIIRTIYKTAPVYDNKETPYLTFSEWRAETGCSSEKGYKMYLKSLNLLR